MDNTTLNNINMAMFGDVVNTSESSILENISSLRSQISQLLEQLEDLPTLRRRALTTDNINSLRAKWPTLRITSEGGVTVLDLADHHVNFLYGRLQELQNIKNTSIVYQTLPRYSTRIKVHPNRHVEISNTTSAQLRDLSGIQRRVASTISRTPIPQDAGVRLFNSPGDGFHVSHPHAQGSRNGFTTICYGNNRWSEALSRAANGTDVLSAFDRALLWASSANMLDMYGNYLSDGFHPTSPEGQLPTAYRTALNDVMRYLITHLQKPILDFIQERGQQTTSLIEDTSFAACCDDLLSDIEIHQEFESVFSAQRFLDLHGGPLDSGTPHPLIWALIALRGFLVSEDNQGMFNYPSAGATISVILMALKKAYAMWLLVHSRYIHNCKNCFISALRTDAYSMSKYVRLTDTTIMQALQAPLGFYSVVQHEGAGATTLEAIEVCNFA